MTDIGQRARDINTAYGIKRALEDHGAPNVLVCDPQTRKSFAIVFTTEEWDAIAKEHNKVVDCLESAEEEIVSLKEALEGYEEGDRHNMLLLNAVHTAFGHNHGDELKNLRSRVSEQRKQITLHIEQAKRRNQEIAYWKAVAEANLSTLNHYGIKAPKVKAPRPAEHSEQEFLTVGGYL
jgi:hypothetical protein